MSCGCQQGLIYIEIKRSIQGRLNTSQNRLCSYCAQLVFNIAEPINN